MSSNKRRKLDVSPKKPQLSAFAARQAALKSKTGSAKSPGIQTRSSALSDDTLNTNSKVTSLEDTNTQIAIEDAAPLNGADSGASEIYTDFDKSAQLTPSLGSRAETPEIQLERRLIPLSSFKPSKSNLKDVGGGTLKILLAPGERLVIVGQYELCVQKGQITLMGATLQPSETFQRVFSASSHSLPVIRCLSTDVNSAEIFLRICNSGLEDLEQLSPLFGRLWNNQSGPLGTEYKNSLPKFPKSTFQILFSSKLDQQPSYLQPLASPPEWNLLLSKLSEPAENKRVIMVCGPKSSGKSTFARILGNRLLSILETPGSATTSTGVAVLDLDPGQPEYSPPGQLALVHVQEPNFGTPFSHPVPAGKSKILRSHSIASISPSSDPSLYMSCVLDLFSHYRNMASAVRECPLIINTPGWVFGTGLEILVDLIGRVKPTEVIYMSQDGPPEVVGTLREAASVSNFFTLPSQISEYTTRTAAHLRTMQAMSYFHLAPESPNNLLWRSQPLTHTLPWEIRYTGENPGIMGVICYGEQPPPELLPETINGSLVAVIVVDDMAAIPSQTDNDHGEQTYPVPKQQPTFEAVEPMEFDPDLHVYNPTPQPCRLEEPFIIPTPLEKIPYFNPANAITLDPRYSHSVGLALVRGIDVARRRIQLLTPIAPKVIEEINEQGKKIVLVSGKLDTPGWAYTEELNMRGSKDKVERKQVVQVVDVSEEEAEEEDEGNLDDEDDEDEESVDAEGRAGKDSTKQGEYGGQSQEQDVPWVERLDGSKGRGVGSRVWRVRRDLGRIGDGGD